MKMKDEFDLPVSGVSLEYLFRNTSDAQDAAAARAINCHDELIDALNSVLEQYWYSTADFPDEFEAREDIIAARKIIAKATGEQ